MEGEFVLDTHVVRAFVADVEQAIAGSSSPEAACDAIRPRFSELLADPDWLPAAFQADAPESGMGGGIGQWLLYRAGDGSLSLFSLVVPPARRRRSTTTSPGGSSASTAARRTRRSTRTEAVCSSSSSTGRSARATSTR